MTASRNTVQRHFSDLLALYGRFATFDREWLDRLEAERLTPCAIVTNDRPGLLRHVYFRPDDGDCAKTLRSAHEKIRIGTPARRLAAEIETCSHAFLDAASAAGLMVFVHLTVIAFRNGSRHVRVQRLETDGLELAINPLKPGAAERRFARYLSALDAIDALGIPSDMRDPEMPIEHHLMLEEASFLRGRARDLALRSTAIRAPSMAAAWMRHQAWIAIVQDEPPLPRPPAPEELSGLRSTVVYPRMPSQA